MTSASRIQTRIEWLDEAKALGVFWVVYGHSLSTEWGIGKWIYSFHMPYFFIISGYLAKMPPDPSASNYLKKTFLFLMANYFTFAAIGYVFWALVQSNFGESKEISTNYLTPILATLYGTGTPFNFSVIPRFLWFLPCLAVAQFLVFLIFSIPRGLFRGIVVGACASFGIFLLKPFALPFEIESAFTAAPFLALGHQIRVYDALKYLKAPLALSVLLLGSICGCLNAGVDIRASVFGNVILFFASSILISIGLLGILRNFTFCPSISRRISQNAVYVLGLHSIVGSLMVACYKFPLVLSLETRRNPAFGFLESLAIVFLAVCLSPFVVKALPWTARKSERA